MYLVDNDSLPENGKLMLSVETTEINFYVQILEIDSFNFGICIIYLVYSLLQ